MTMKSYAIASLTAAFAGITSIASAQDAESHFAAAKAAAGTDHVALFEATCERTPGPPAALTGPREVPERSTWHHEPVKVFDNLYYIGEKEYSAWAVITSDGIIVLDTIWSHSVEDEIVNGLKKLGFDPAQIKYALVSHAHIDHIGGAKYLQEKFGTHIVMSAADWDFAEASTRLPAEIKPKRDVIATDGYKLTLGNTTLTLHLTPGHTPGTISTIFTVQDGGKPHTVATWGGTSFNFQPSPKAFQTYIDSAVSFEDVVKKAGPDIILSNHTIFDGSLGKFAALAARKPGDPNPFVTARIPCCATSRSRRSARAPNWRRSSNADVG
jgi:metallo-beta-lactamase class B